MAVFERPITEHDNYTAVPEAIPDSNPRATRIVKHLGRFLTRMADIAGVSYEEAIPASLYKLLRLDNETRNAALVGGGTISFGLVTNRVKWTSPFHFLPISDGVAPDGSANIALPTSGVMDANNSERATTDGVLLNHAESIWFLHTRGSTKDAGNTLRVVQNASTLEQQLFVNPDAYRICTRIDENSQNVVFFRNGISLVHGVSLSNQGADIAGVGSISGLKPALPGGNLPIVAGANIGVAVSGGQLVITGASGAASGLTTVSSVSLLETLTGAIANETRYLLGYNGAGTGGEGYMVRLASPPGGAVRDGVQYFTSADGGLWRRIWSAPLNIEAAGCVGDDSTLNDARLAAAIALGTRLYIPKGIFRISTLMSIAVSQTIIEGPGTIKQVTPGLGAFSYGSGVTNVGFYGIKVLGSSTDSDDTIGVRLPADSEFVAQVGGFNRGVTLEGPGAMATEAEVLSTVGLAFPKGIGIDILAPDCVASDNRITSQRSLVTARGHATFGGGQQAKITDNKGTLVSVGSGGQDGYYAYAEAGQAFVDGVQIIGNDVEFLGVPPSGSFGVAFYERSEDGIASNNGIVNSSYAGLFTEGAAIGVSRRHTFESNTVDTALGSDYVAEDAGSIPEDIRFIDNQSTRLNPILVDEGLRTVVRGNKGIHDYAPEVIISGATPSVGDAQRYIVQNGSATTITNLLNGHDGQMVYLVLDANTSVAHNSNINLSASRTLPPDAEGNVVQLVRTGGKWMEVGGSIWVKSLFDETTLSGLELVWDDADTLGIESGMVFIPSTQNMVKVPSRITKDVIFTPNSSARHYVYGYDNNGVLGLDDPSTVAPVRYLGFAKHKTGDTSRRYLGMLLPNGAPVPVMRKFRMYKNGMVRWLDNPFAAPFRLVDGDVSGAATARNTAETTVSTSSVVPPLTRLVQMSFSSWSDSATFYYMIGSSEDTFALSYATALHWSYAYKQGWNAEIPVHLDAAGAYTFRWSADPGSGNGLTQAVKGYWEER